MHAPAPIGRLRKVAHLGVGEYLRAVVHGVGKIGERDRVLGADVAASAAVAAARAGGLLDAGGIDCLPEAHRHRRRDRLLAQRRPGGGQRFELGALGGIGIARGPDPAGRPGIAFGDEPVLYDFCRPDFVMKYAWIGPERHASIDQRAAAEAAADQDVHVLAEAHIIKPGGGTHAQTLARHLHLLAQIGKAAWKFARQELAAPFQNRDALAGPCQPGSGNSRAITRADHDHVVVPLHALQWSCEPGHSRIDSSPCATVGSVHRTAKARPASVNS